MESIEIPCITILYEDIFPIGKLLTLGFLFSCRSSEIAKKKKYPFQTRRATSGVEGGRSPLPFFRNKCAQIFGKSVPFLCIYELHSHLKFDLKCILRVSQRKKQNFPCGAFLLYVIHEMFIEVPLFPRILLCLKKFLVAHQQTEV